MSDIPVTHVCPTSEGGVSDYVDICTLHQTGTTKISLSKKLAESTPLSGHVLLHYSGYGYANRGAPLWLLDKLRTDRANIETLGIFFHELYAFGPPWGSAFWLSRIQRHIVKSIAELCDYWITNRDESSTWLRSYAADKPQSVMPVFSNVGELASYNPRRAKAIVVFGGAALRASTYRAAGAELFEWAHANGLVVHDIGPAIDDVGINELLGRGGATIHGRLAANEVSGILAESSFGLVKYSVEYVAKSGVFAAYAAHGVCPIVISRSCKVSDGLIPGANYLYGLSEQVVLDELAQSIGLSAWKWYQSHRIEDHVSVQLSLLRQACKC